MEAVVAAFNQEKALVGAFSVIVQPVVEPMDRFAALTFTRHKTRGTWLTWEESGPGHALGWEASRSSPAAVLWECSWGTRARLTPPA